jgi:hypothetical protein
MASLAFWRLPKASRIFLALVLTVFGLGLAVRMLDLADAPFDFHPTRQLRDALIARGIYYGLSPAAEPSLRAQAIMLGETSDDLEPPLLETIVALTYLVIGGEYLGVARVYSSLFWLIGGFAVLKLARRHTGPAGGVTALAVYLFLPYGAIASRSFQPDPFMVMWVLLAIWRLDSWAEGRSWRDAALAGFCSGIAVVVKPVAATVLGGALVAVVLSELGLRQMVKDRQVWLMAGLSIGLPLLFYGAIYQHSAGFLSFWITGFSHLLLQPIFYFNWLRLLSDIVDIGLIFLGAVGVIMLSGRFRWILIGMWIGYVILGLLFPYHIHTHDYYSLVFVPIVSLSLAPWGKMAFERSLQLSRPWRAAMTGVVVIVAAYYLWMARVAVVGRNYRGKVAEVQHIGEALPGDGRTIALTTDYGFPLAYYAWRKVDLWPTTVELNTEALRDSSGSGETFYNAFAEKTDGVRYFLVTLMGELDAQPALREELYSNHTIVSQGDDYVLFDLHRPAAAP